MPTTICSRFNSNLKILLPDRSVALKISIRENVALFSNNEAHQISCRTTEQVKLLEYNRTTINRLDSIPVIGMLPGKYSLKTGYVYYCWENRKPSSSAWSLLPKPVLEIFPLVYPGIIKTSNWWQKTLYKIANETRKRKTNARHCHSRTAKLPRTIIGKFCNAYGKSRQSSTFQIWQ